MESWEGFLERLLERLHTLRAREIKCNVTILMGRRDKDTQALFPPEFQVHEFNPPR